MRWEGNSCGIGHGEQNLGSKAGYSTIITKLKIGCLFKKVNVSDMKIKVFTVI